MLVSTETRGRKRKPHAAMLADLQAGVETLEVIGQRYGVTRERVRQIAKREGINIARRQSIRTSHSISKRVQHDLFPEAYNAVWREAEKHGLTVKAWSNAPAQIRRDALFINSRRCWISHLTKVVKTHPSASRMYGRTGSIRPGSRIVLFDNPLDGSRNFYIFVASEFRQIYIPANASKLKRHTDDWQLAHKNAWHLLAADNQMQEAI